MGFGVIMCIICMSSVMVMSHAFRMGKNDTENDNDNNNINNNKAPFFGSNEVPFPGSAWLDRLATKSESTVILNSMTYATPYHALLYNDPASKPVRNFNEWINSFLIPTSLVAAFLRYFGIERTHYLITYLRNFVAGAIVYYTTAAIFHYHCYIHPRSKDIFKDRPRPSYGIMIHQICLAQFSMIFYTALPVVSDFLIEEGYTQCYYTFPEVGGVLPGILFLILYFALVEIGIYWMHRTLHTNKFLYKHVHMLHHQYNKPETLTPWASIAFHPLDGILQASPYVLWMPFVPVHYLTHEVLLFCTAVWATFIHDSMDFNIDPIMGSRYHTLHHTHYIYNYGQVFTFCDRFWGTLRVPIGKTGLVNEDGTPARIKFYNPCVDDDRVSKKIR